MIGKTASLWAACLALFLAAPAAGQTAAPEPASTASAVSVSEPQAKDLKEAGDQAMGRLEYGSALDLYTRAYQIEPHPALLYNKGRALQALGRFPEALDELEAFERSADPELKSKVPKLGELIADVRKRVSTLKLSANVAGARVLVRRQVIGTTPLAPQRLNAGGAAIEVLADGHHPFKQEIKLPGGGEVVVQAMLHSKATTGILEVRSPVAGAHVFVDGERIGSVPAQAALPAGEHQVLVRREGYREVSTTAVIAAGKTTALDVALDAPPPITSTWWFWTGVGAVVVGGVVLTVALLTERSPDEGDIPPGRVSGPLLSF
jgi:hypothetical protein